MALQGKEEISTSIQPKFQIPARPNIMNLASGSQFGNCKTIIQSNAQNSQSWVLPKPASINGINTSFDWSELESGVIGDVIQTLQNGYNSIKDNGVSDVLNGIKGAFDNQQARDTVHKLMEKGLLHTAQAMAPNVTGIALQKLGKSYNPQTIKAFKAPHFRSYTFSFNIVPQNEAEFRKVQAGLKSFRQAASRKTGR